MAEPRSRHTHSTMRCPTSSGSRDCETSRPTSARTSASRRRPSVSARRCAFPIAMAAWLARRLSAASSRSVNARAGALSGLDQETDERVIRRAARAAPVDHPNAVSAGLSQGDLGAVGAGELAGPVDDAREDRREVERAVDLPDDLGEHVDLVPAPGRVVEELNALEHERRLVGESLGQPDLALEKDPARAIAHRERADHAVLDQEREGEDRAVRGALEALEDRWVVLDARIVGEVRGRDRSPLAGGEPDDAGAARKDGAWAERLLP